MSCMTLRNFYPALLLNVHGLIIFPNVKADSGTIHVLHLEYVLKCQNWPIVGFELGLLLVPSYLCQVVTSFYLQWPPSYAAILGELKRWPHKRDCR